MAAIPAAPAAMHWGAFSRVDSAEGEDGQLRLGGGLASGAAGFGQSIQSPTRKGGAPGRTFSKTGAKSARVAPALRACRISATEWQETLTIGEGGTSARFCGSGRRLRPVVQGRGRRGDGRHRRLPRGRLRLRLSGLALMRTWLRLPFSRTARTTLAASPVRLTTERSLSRIWMKSMPLAAQLAARATSLWARSASVSPRRMRLVMA